MSPIATGTPLTFDYDTVLGVLARVRDSVGRAFTFEYGASHEGRPRLTRVVDSSLDRSIRFSYDPEGRLATLEDARGTGFQTSYTYSAAGLLAQVRRPRGNTVDVAYDSAGRVERVQQAPGKAIVFAYETPGTGRVTVTGPDGDSTTYGHDQSFALSLVRSKLGSAMDVTYDPSHPTLPSAIVDALGRSMWFKYDANGNVTRLIDALGQLAELDWDGRNNLVRMTQFRVPGETLRETLYRFDAAGNLLLEETNPAGETTRYEYFPDGQVRASYDALGGVTSYAYDSQGNVASVRDPEGGEWLYTRDAAGRILTVRDADAKLTGYHHDPNDAVVRIADHDGHSTEIELDRNDNVAALSYLRGGARESFRYRYDEQDRLIGVDDPAGTTTSFSYTDGGLLRSRTDGNGATTMFSHDEDQRLVKVDYPDGAATFTWDAAGQLLTAANENGTIRWSYDELGRVAACTSAFGLTVSYSYFPHGGLREVTYPGGGTVRFEHGSVPGRITRVTDWTGGSTEYRYDPAGNLSEVLHSNRTRTTLQHDLASRVASLEHATAAGALFAAWRFTLDPAGNPLKVDALEPLEAFAPAAEDITFAVSEGNRLLSERGSRVVDYSHDASGNRTLKQSGGATTRYVHDGANRLRRIEGPGGTVELFHDALGNLIATRAGGVLTRYVLDLTGERSHVLAETDASNRVGTRYVHGVGLAAQVDGAGNRHVHHHDALGNVVAISDPAGRIAARYVYDELGATLRREGTVTSPFRWGGRHGVLDLGDGLYHMRARVYDALTGRFLTKDPSGFAGGDANLYAYVANRVTTRVDPDGLRAIDAVAGFWWKTARKGLTAYAGSLAWGGARFGLEYLRRFPEDGLGWAVKVALGRAWRLRAGAKAFGGLVRGLGVGIASGGMELWYQLQGYDTWAPGIFRWIPGFFALPAQ
ncbi:MAG: RHS repeat protein [Planctomycetes bacterium]|nr:RHS repeat protein [Planctomycetota bacterium]